MQAYDVIVIGAGPAGIFTALELDKLMPQMRVLVVDSGSTIDNRSCPARTSSHCAHCRTCHIMNGWAGAGAFSDGKLSLSEEVGGNVTDYLPVQEVRDLIRYADDIYLKFGAPDKVFGKSDKFAEQVSYEAHKHNIKLIPCPVRHMGTEYSFEVLREMYRYLSSREGFEFREYTKADRQGRGAQAGKGALYSGGSWPGRRGMAHLHRPGKQPANHQQRRGYRCTGGSAQCRDGSPDQKPV